ncbi:hypothetical protein HZA97_05920 [Candidatus Woesearchaeota archaeon]|nr:hypothetical protein [Candidatus Woesearchaeota archaeon]
MSLTNLLRKVNKLPDKVDNVYVSILGNRFNVMFQYLSLSSAVLFYTFAELNSPVLATFSAYGSFLSAICSAWTCCGRSTPKYYKRTEEHIKKFGELRPRFLEKLISKTENKEFTGYCQLQGAYLAARKHGQLGVFYDVKRRCSNNVLPNF